MVGVVNKVLAFGYSPCPNDTFMFNAIAGGTIGVEGHTLRPVLHDVETLNTMAMLGALDVSKLSFYAWLAVRDRYRLLSSGSAMGFGCGPVLIARRAMDRDAISRARIVLPGRWTTGHLLLRLYAPDAHRRIFTPYDRIFDLLNSGEADCGVIIHESRFTFEAAGFRPLVDLGAWWEAQTGMPIPLGGIAARKELGPALIQRIDGAVRSSIEHAMQNPDGALPYVRKYAQEMDDQVLSAHIRTFVNDFSLDFGDRGREAIDTLARMATDAGAL